MVKLSRSPHSGYTHHWKCQAGLTYCVPTQALLACKRTTRQVLLKQVKRQKQLKFVNEASAARTTSRQLWSPRGSCWQHPLLCQQEQQDAPLPTPMQIKTCSEVLWMSPATGQEVASPCPGGSQVLWKEQGGEGRSPAKCRLRCNLQATGWSLLK